MFTSGPQPCLEVEDCESICLSSLSTTLGLLCLWPHLNHTAFDVSKYS